MLRPVAVQRYLAVMQARGFHAQGILAGSGIDRDHLGRHDFLVEPEQCRIVVQNMLKQSGNQGIGFDVALNTTLADLGVVGHAVMTCKSIRESHHLWNDYGKALVGMVGRFQIMAEDESSVTLGITDQDMRDPLATFYIEEQLGNVHMIGQPLAGETPFVREAAFSYPVPNHEARYHGLLKCPILFDAPRTCIRLDRRWFDMSVHTYDEEFNRLCVQHCDRIVQRIAGKPPLVVCLREFFLKAERATVPKMDEAARRFNLSSRTLRRRLLDEGTTYKAEVDAFQVQQAHEYLSRRDLAVKEVAFRLGFTDPSAFRHAFKKWTGYTVGEYQTQMRQSDQATITHH